MTLEPLFPAEENNEVSLSRLENKSWFLKGSNSQKITLRAFNTLQAAYMLRANNSIEMGNYFDPNILLPFQSITLSAILKNFCKAGFVAT